MKDSVPPWPSEMRLQRLSDRLQGAAKQVYNTYSVWHQTVHNDLPVICPLRAAPFRLGLRGRSWGRFFSGEIEASPTSRLLGNRLVLPQRIIRRSHRFTSRSLDPPGFPTRFSSHSGYVAPIPVALAPPAQLRGTGAGFLRESQLANLHFEVGSGSAIGLEWLPASGAVRVSATARHSKG